MRPYSYQIRQEAIRLYEQGKSQVKISEELRVSYKTVRTWISRYRKLGFPSTLCDYTKCGRKQKYDQSIIDRAVRYKREHPNWGAGFILLKLQDDFPTSALPKQRQLQNYFQKYEVQIKKHKLPKGKADWSKAPFDRVQVDAKECLKTADGLACCYLNYTDEYTGSDLDAFAFPLCSYLRSTSNRTDSMYSLCDVSLGIH